MKIKVIYDNIKDKELIETIEFSTPFFVEYINIKTKNGQREAFKIKEKFSARLNPFVVVYDNKDKFIECFWSETQNACQSFVSKYKNGSIN